MPFLRVQVMIGATAMDRVVNVDDIIQVMPQPSGSIAVMVRTVGVLNLAQGWTLARLEAVLPMLLESPSGPAEASGAPGAPAPSTASPKRRRR